MALHATTRPLAGLHLSGAIPLPVVVAPAHDMARAIATPIYRSMRLTNKVGFSRGPVAEARKRSIDRCATGGQIYKLVHVLLSPAAGRHTSPKRDGKHKRASYGSLRVFANIIVAHYIAPSYLLERL